MIPCPPPVPAGERAFLVARQGVEVVIREVPQGSSLVEWTRADAWALAHRYAQPAPRAQGNRRLGVPIFFMGLDGSRREVAPAPTPEQKVKPVHKYTITLMVRKTKVRHTVEVEAANKPDALAAARAQFQDATTLVECTRHEIAPCVPPLCPLYVLAGTHAATRPQGRAHHGFRPPLAQAMAKSTAAAALPWE